MKDFTHNTFRAADAFEYVDAYRKAVAKTPAEVRELHAKLNERIGNYDPPSYLLAAYRAYEDALLFLGHKIEPRIVKLDDTDPTPIDGGL